MRRNEFTNLVRQRAGLESNEQADAATVATLSALSERLSHGQAQDVAGQLPTNSPDRSRPPASRVRRN